MIRIGICDDSPAFLNQAEFMIEHWDNLPENTVVKLFDNGDSLILAHSQNPFDILLLDVVMPLMNGIDVAREIRESDKNVKIVFLTSSPEFAVDSYSVKANYYLLKPIEPLKLFACLDELIEEIKIVSKCLTIKGLDAIHRVPLSKIEYIESQSKHIVFFMIGNTKIESKEPLYAYEDILLHEDGFFKCHRSYIVNIHHIDRYSHSEIMMHSGYRIPISRSHQKAFEDMYFRVIFEEAGDDI